MAKLRRMSAAITRALRRQRRLRNSPPDLRSSLGVRASSLHIDERAWSSSFSLVVSQKADKLRLQLHAPSHILRLELDLKDPRPELASHEDSLFIPVVSDTVEHVFPSRPVRRSENSFQV